MDSMLEKFGIYDIMGIWGPGAITVTYFFATLHQEIESLLTRLEIDIPALSEPYSLVIMYSVVAYCVGVVLHEIGKALAERTSWFSPATVINCMDPQMVEKRGLWWRIRLETAEIINESIKAPVSSQLNFHQAIAFLKFEGTMHTKRIDTYHSVYALSRSLALCFTFHITAEVLAIMFTELHCKAAIGMLIFDIIMAMIFLGRAYRYYHSWVRNAYAAE